MEVSASWRIDFLFLFVQAKRKREVNTPWRDGYFFKSISRRLVKSTTFVVRTFNSIVRY
jgi:hypothetical protein